MHVQRRAWAVGTSQLVRLDMLCVNLNTHSELATSGRCGFIGPSKDFSCYPWSSGGGTWWCGLIAAWMARAAMNASSASLSPLVPKCGRGVGPTAFRRCTLGMPVCCGVQSGGYHHIGNGKSHLIGVRILLGTIPP
jgi:hypothetical protein